MHEPGSLKDLCSRIGMERERLARYSETLAIVNAIISVGNALVATISHTPAQQSVKKGKDVMELLKELLLPQVAENNERDAEKVKARLKAELDKGPFKVRSMAYSKRRGRKHKF